MIALWLVVFVVALLVLVKGSGWFLESAEKIGLALGITPFVVGAVIIGFGTSVGELVTSVFAVIDGVPIMVAANAIGSNITNILLVVGVSAVLTTRLVVTKNLVDVEIPLLATATALFVGVSWDAMITRVEAMMLVIAYVVYFLYTVYHKDEGPEELYTEQVSEEKRRPQVTPYDTLKLILGLIGLLLGARYTVESVINLSQILGVGIGVISLFAVALGTSLPELFVSVKAAMNKKSEVALGNIYGSSVFNLLVVVGIPGLVRDLPIDFPTHTLALPVLMVVTLIFILSGISKRLHVWEGSMYLLLYVFFIGKLFGFV